MNMGKIMDYNAKIDDIKGAIKIKENAHQSTEVLHHKLTQVRTKQLKVELRDERKRAKAKV